MSTLERAALIVAAALACSPLAYGYYGLTIWAPLGIGAAILLVALAFGPRPRLTRHGAIAASGLAVLLVLSFASILWSESRDSAWTSANRVAVYAVVFAIGLLGVRSRAGARTTMLVLGAPALITAAVLALEFAVGGGTGAFAGRRLQAPMGYANATACLFEMGLWPWLALAERLSSPRLRVAANAAAALIAATTVLTQSRAAILVTVATIALVLLAAPGRTRRVANLLAVLAAVAASAPFTLRVYSTHAPSQLQSVNAGALRWAGIALIAAALLAAALRLAVGRAIAPLARRDRLHTHKLRHGVIGRALLALLAVAALGAAVSQHRQIADQWRALMGLGNERTATDRFTALGGGDRADLWRIALDEFVGDPLGGVGAGNYDDRYYRLRRRLAYVTNPHSLELQVLAELGVGGAIGLGLLITGVLAAGLTRRRSTLTSGDPALRVAALGAFVAWLAGTSIDWFYDIPGLTGMALVAAAVLVAPAEPSAAGPPAPSAAERNADRITARPRRPRQTVVAAGGALVLVALLAASLGRQYVATLYADAGQRLVAHNPRRALQRLRTAEGLDPWALETRVAIAAAYARMDAYGPARAALEQAERLEPENFVPPALLGDLATRAGDEAAALDDYRRALRLDPLEPELRRDVRAAQLALRRSHHHASL